MNPIILTPLVGSGSEQIILDPSEVATEREELDAHSSPILIRQEGPDWGDAEIVAYMADAALGEIPVDFRLPNRKVTIPLMATSDDSVEFSQARLDLQAKVARFQQEGGQLKRELKNGAKLYLDIVNATLKMGGSTAQALWDVDADIDLVLEVLPDFYGDEQETALVDGVIEDVRGDYPGRVRVVVTENDGQDQRGLIGAFRCRHYSAATTAQTTYEAEDLEPLDSATVATLSGASGGDVVQHNDLSTNWTPVLGTNIGGTDFLTHTGTNRIIVRAYSPDGDAVQLRFVYDVGDLVLPEENAPVTLPGASNFYLLDIGAARLDPVPSGDHRWQGQVQARGEVGGESVSIDTFEVVNADEAMWKLSAPVNPSQGLGPLSARDEFNQTAGALTGKTAPVGGVWTAFGGDTSDWNMDTGNHVAERADPSDTAMPSATLAGRAISCGTGATTALEAQVDFRHQIGYVGSRSGLLLRALNTSNYLTVSALIDDPTTVTVQMVKASVESFLLNETGLVNLVAGTWYTLRVLIDTTGRWLVWIFPQGAVEGDPVAVGQSADLATGGALASGKCGLFDGRAVGVSPIRLYDNFAAFVPTLDAVLYANQSAELRHDGHFREDATGAAYGPISHVTGDLPRLPPSGLEGRPVEVYLRTSRGDLGQLPDSGLDTPAYEVWHRPSWLFVPEAA